MNIIQIQIPTSNYAKGRGSNSVNKIVLHWMAGTLAGTDSRFKNPSSGVSAHYGIENDVIHQYVTDTDTAFHAGVYIVNQQSIGIEHSADPNRPASNATYESSAQLIATLCKKYNLNPDTALHPHKEYKPTQCPGTLNLDIIKARVKTIIGGETMIEDLNHLNSLWRAYLGRESVAGEQSAYIGKISYTKMIESLDQSPERKNGGPNLADPNVQVLKDSLKKFLA